MFVFNREIRVKPFRTKFTNILTGLGVTAALLFSIPSSAVSQETALPGKGEVVLEKAGEIELGDLIKQWASEMDHVYAETRIQAKDTNKKIFERLGINDKAFVSYVNSIKGKENPFARLQTGRLIQARLTPTGEVISLRVFRPIDSLSRDVAYFQVSKESGKFKHANLKSEIDAFPIASSAVIKTSLESAAVSANIPANVLTQIKERLSTSMDVNKGVAVGDSALFMNAVRLTVPTSVPANFWRLNISPKARPLILTGTRAKASRATLIPKATTRTLRSCVCPVKPV